MVDFKHNFDFRSSPHFARLVQSHPFFRAPTQTKPQLYQRLTQKRRFSTLTPRDRPHTACHLKAREGRTYGDRGGFRGWSSGKAWSPRFPSGRRLRDGSAQAHPRGDETPTLEAGGQVSRWGLKSPSRSGRFAKPSARRGPTSEAG